MDDASFIQSLVEGYGTSSNHTTVYGYCSNEAEGETNLILQCITEVMEQKQLEGDRNVNRWLMLFSGGLIFFMQTGFAMLCAGCVRKKNVQNTMLKNLLDACGAALGFFVLGYAFAFGGQDDRDDVTFIGTSNFLNTGKVDMSFWFFQFAFSATAVTIVAGTLAERCQMVAYLCYSIFLTGFVYPVAAHTIWSRNGFLSSTAVDPFQGVGAIDFAGSGVVHLTGGTTALVATYILGARKGRFYDNRGRQLETPKSFPGHSVALQLLGTFVLWFGWYGFNPGSALLLAHTSDTGFVASRAAVNTSLSAAAGAVSALMTNMFMEERSTGEYSFNIIMAMNGALAGLVSITAACGTVQNWAALCIGCIGGLIYLWGSKTLVRLKLDDAVDAIPVHMFAGGWGLLAVGLFSDPDLMHIAYGTGNHPGLLYSWGSGEFNAILLSNQVLELVFVAGWAFGTMTPFFLFINRMGWFRSDSLEELVGLDEAYHGGKHGGEEVVEVSALEGFIKNKIRQSQIRSPYN